MSSTEEIAGTPPAKAPRAKKPKVESLRARLLKVTAECPRIMKVRQNRSPYPYIKHDDIMSSLKPLYVRHDILFNVQSQAFLDSDVLLCRVTISFNDTHSDSFTTIQTDVCIEKGKQNQQDTGGAVTYGVKTLLQNFHMIEGYDPNDINEDDIKKVNAENKELCKMIGLTADGVKKMFEECDHDPFEFNKQLAAKAAEGEK